MTERSFWRDFVNGALNTPDKRNVAIKVQDSFVKGLPDVLFNVGGSSGLMELKFSKTFPEEGTFTFPHKISVEQHAHLRMWARSDGGRAFVLLGIEKGRRWILLRWNVPNSFPLHELPQWRVAEGSMDDPQSLFNAVASYNPITMGA